MAGYCQQSQCFAAELVHVANFTTGNAGDAVLTTVLRDLFSQAIGGVSWTKLHDTILWEKRNYSG